MAVKKNKRGLGRGLSALIQNTEERPETVSDVNGDAVDEPSEPSGLAETSVSTGTGAEDQASDHQDPTVRAETARVPGSDDGEQQSPATPRPDVSSRYLGRSAQGEGTMSPQVPRETRRPVDVFFPERGSDNAERTTTRSTSGDQARSRGRRSVPDLSLSRSRSSVAADALRAGSGAGTQREAVEDKGGVPEERGVDAGPSRGVLPDGSEMRALPVGDIHPNPRQPREVFDEEDMDELVASIREVGVLQPVVVRPVRGDSPYELVMGERRWRASRKAGLTEIPAIIRHTSDEDLLRDALLENLHRSQLNPLEEAAAYQQLLEEFGATQEELSRRIGRSRPQISNTLRLMRLPPLVQRRVAAGVLSAGHARALLALEDPAEMERLAQRIVAEGMSVRAAEEAASLSKRGKPGRRPAARAQERHRERLDYIADAFSDKLDTSVKINLGARKGRMTIEFASVEDLNRIISVLDPQAQQSDESN